MKILLVEDEKLLADSLVALLTGKGFQVEAVYDGESGAEYAELGIYDLLILDVMMPGLDGYQVARRVRSKRCAVPILMLTARSGVLDQIEGLNAGADYYLTKPFDSRELLACINALLRRQGNQVDTLRFGNTELDLSTSILHCGEESVRLSAREFDVMRACSRRERGSPPRKACWPGSGVMIPTRWTTMWRCTSRSCGKSWLRSGPMCPSRPSGGWATIW